MKTGRGVACRADGGVAWAGGAGSSAAGRRARLGGSKWGIALDGGLVPLVSVVGGHKSALPSEGAA